MNYLHHQIQDPEIPPGFLVRIQIQPMWRTLIHSPNPAIRITKQIKIIKRLISSHRLQKTELCQQRKLMLKGQIGISLERIIQNISF